MNFEIKTDLRSMRGNTLIEYVTLAAFLTLAMVPMVQNTGSGASNTFGRIDAALAQTSYRGGNGTNSNLPTHPGGGVPQGQGGNSAGTVPGGPVQQADPASSAPNLPMPQPPP